MTTAIPTIDAPKSKIRKLKPEDVLHAGTYYSPEEVEWAVSVPAQELQNAFKRGVFRFYRSDRGRGFVLRGSSICSWIDNCGIDWEITSQAASVWHRLHGQTKPTKKVAPAKGVVEQALDEVAGWKSRESNDDKSCAEQSWNSYVAILKREAAGVSEPEDADSLALVVADLGLAGEAVRDDVVLVKRSTDYERLHAQVEQASRAVTEAAANYRDLRSECDRRIREADRAVGTAEGHSRQCRDAGASLLLLARQRPELFDSSVDPPRLKGSCEGNEDSAKRRAKR